jgi:hypothetical protein
MRIGRLVVLPLTAGRLIGFLSGSRLSAVGRMSFEAP